MKPRLLSSFTLPVAASRSVRLSPWAMLALALVSTLPAAGAVADEARRLLRVEDIYSLKDVDDPQLAPDGRSVAYTVTELDAEADEARTQIWMVSLEGGEPIQLTRGEESASAPRFSPDGRYLAFLAARGEDEKTQVWLLDRRGGEASVLTSVQAQISDLAWSPDSARLALVVRDVDPHDPALAKEAADAEEPPPRPVVITRRQFKRDGEGYLTELRDHIHIVDLASRQSRQLTAGSYDDSEPVWSPDGDRIAFVSNRTADPDSNQNSDIFVVDVEGSGEPRALTRSPGTDLEPAFSPDGRWIAYAAGGDPADMWYGTIHLGLVSADGDEERLVTAGLDRNIFSPVFAPDGRAVLFLVEDRGNLQLARLRLRDARIERIVGGERTIMAFDAVADTLVVLESTPQRPFEIHAVTHRSATEPRLAPLSRANDAFLAGIRTAEVERYTVRSGDGTPIDAFLTLPPGAAADERLPTVLRIHGGPTSQYQTEWMLEWQLLAAHGYAVVGANPRGSTGYGQSFARAIWADWGNKDYQDVIAAVDGAIERGIADPERLGVGGWSYGGILTNYVITKTGRFAAATSGASEVNYLANYGHDHYQYEWEVELGLPWDNTELWLRLSPFFDVAKITTPTLILCGSLDWNVPLLNSEQLYQAMKRLGRADTELVVYPDEDHSIDRPSFQLDRYRRYLAWYDRYLK